MTTRAIPGRGWFLAGTVLLALTGAAHTMRRRCCAR